MINIPPIPLWIRFKANFLGRGIILVSKDKKNFEYRLIKKMRKDLAWGAPQQYYQDDKGNFYSNEYYAGHAIIEKVGWKKHPKSNQNTSRDKTQ